MRAIQLTMAAMLLVATGPIMAGQLYKLRVDGLACAYCAYGVEKQFMRTPGVTHVDIDFENGHVLVSTGDDVAFTEEQLRRIVHDAGFTLRGMQVDTGTTP